MRKKITLLLLVLLIVCNTSGCGLMALGLGGAFGLSKVGSGIKDFCGSVSDRINPTSQVNQASESQNAINNVVQYAMSDSSFKKVETWQKSTDHYSNHRSSWWPHEWILDPNCSVPLTFAKDQAENLQQMHLDELKAKNKLARDEMWNRDRKEKNADLKEGLESFKGPIIIVLIIIVLLILFLLRRKKKEPAVAAAPALPAGTVAPALPGKSSSHKLSLNKNPLERQKKELKSMCKKCGVSYARVEAKYGGDINGVSRAYVELRAALESGNAAQVEEILAS